MRGLLRVLGGSALGVLWGGCEVSGGYTLREHRAAVNGRCQEVLEDLYARAPEARSRVEAAPGHAVFRQGGLKVPLPGAGAGYGVAVDNRDGRRTFMRTGGLGADPGAGFVVVFPTREVFRGFVQGGWEFGAGDPPGVRVYRVSHAVLSGTRCWTDRVLNPATTRSRPVRSPSPPR